MELHVCRNCQMINQVIGNQTCKFNILSEENVVLHNLLIKARQSLRELSDKLQQCQEALVTEREHNLQLYLKEHTDTSKAIGKEFINELSIGQANKASNIQMKEESEILESPQYMNLLKAVQELQQNQQITVEMLNNENKRHNALLSEHVYQTEEHVSMVLELNKSLRHDLFVQKKQSINDREEFLKTVDVITTSNEKYLQEVKRSIVSATTTTADKLTKQAINSMCRQLNARDKLVVMLRKQQTLLQVQIEQLQKREKSIKDDHKVMIDKLRWHIKYEQEKQTNLEQQRKFDAEGFRNDIKIIRKEIKMLNDKLKKLPKELRSKETCEQLLKNADTITDKLDVYFI